MKRKRKSTDSEENIRKAITSTRPVRKEKKKLFDLEPDWKDIWWGMPEFVIKDANPQFQIVMNFMTAEDVKDFAKKLGIKVSPTSNSAWWPEQQKLKGEYAYSGPPTDSKYPICIPSKGRADCQTVSKRLDKLGVSYNFFVEETEEDWYCEHVGEENVVAMPFHDLGKGSIPARNYIWEWAKEREYRRHWCLDDNLQRFQRTNINRRLSVEGGGYFRAMEDFVDRFENIAMAGPHEIGFMPDRGGSKVPYLFNSRIYSCILIDTNLPHRWRGKYNEDTDLSLRVLKDGYCTCLFRAFLMGKPSTHSGSSNKKTGAMKGGNTDNVYNSEDYRMNFAKSLQKQHPDVVKIVWRYGRWHHLVNYAPFKKNKPILKKGIVPIKENNEYGMRLIRRK